MGDLAASAGQILGDEAVVSTTVRLWHYEYVTGKGILRPDERGHYTRELLVMKEDIKHKFVKWSLSAARKSELSVVAARDFLNDKLLINLEVCDTIVVGTTRGVVKG